MDADRNFDTAAFKQRFKAERERCDLTYQQVSGQVVEITDGAKGSSYGAVYAYENDPPDPPRGDIVRALAEVFRIEFKWLMWGEDPRTKGAASEEAISVEAAAETETLVRLWTKDLSEAVDKAMGTKVPGVARAVIAHHWRRLHELASYSERTREPARDTLDRLLRAMIAPLEIATTEVGKLDKDDLAAYLIGVVPAVAKAMELQIRQQVLAEIEDGFTKEEESKDA